MGLRMHTRAIVILVFALCHRTLVRSKELPTRVVRATILPPTFDFNTLATMLTCEPATISWSYQANTLPDTLQLMMVITNQPYSPAPRPRPQPYSIHIVDVARWFHHDWGRVDLLYNNGTHHLGVLQGRRSRKWAVLSPTDFQAKAYPLASHSTSRSPHDSDSSAASSYPGSDTMSLGVGYDSSQPPTPAYPSGTSQALAAAYTGYVNETMNGPPLGAPHTDTSEYNLIDPVLVSPPPIAQDSDSGLWLEGSKWNRHSDLGS
ncbi:hypothetical protein K438DRAFT_2144046 [Mycena galopus ATCC 62051]|nr:hypothetical protein K438DRAFT_2144046 [Mycena galopus ATCC 62051]